MSNANPERILVVEDSATQAEAQRALLAGAGYRVEVARTGEEALAQLGRQRFELVLSDVVMPGMSGHELCRAIKSDATLEHRPRVVLLTSLTDPREIVRSLESGADNFITKPYDGERLLARVRQVLDDGDVAEPLAPDGAVPVGFMGERFTIRSEPARILNLLLASFEELIHTAQALQKSQQQLARVHARELEREQAARARAEQDAERLEQLRLRAEEASRARDEVLAAVSHDLRNPLGTIYTSASLLLDMPLSEELRTRQLEIIRRTSQRMERLIQDLLDVSRIEGGGLTLQCRREDVASLLREVMEQFTPVAATKGVRLVEANEGRGASVFADRDRLLRVFSNLIGNAIKFTPEQGTVTVRARPEGSVVRFAIVDTGPGVPIDDQPHIFDRFWQSSRARTAGAGLGLAIAKGIVEAHGGTIGVESQPPGATFYFTVPTGSAPP